MTAQLGSECADRIHAEREVAHKLRKRCIFLGNMAASALKRLKESGANLQDFEEKFLADDQANITKDHIGFLAGENPAWKR